MYDAALGRTFQLDPHADNYYDLSSYSWTANNPINIIDPDGKDIINIAGGVKYTEEDAQDMFRQIQAASGRGGGSRPNPVGIGRGSSFNARLDGRDPYNDDDCCAIQGKSLVASNLPKSNSGGDNSDAAFVNEVSMGFTPMGVAQDWYTLFTGKEFYTGESVPGLWRVAGLILFVSEARKGSKVAKAVTRYWPENGGALGKWETQYLMPGTEIDRFGSGFGRYFSPRGTPMNMRALPGGNSGAYNAFRVVKPFPVRSSTIAPAFNQFGRGIQYLSPVNMNTLLKRGIIVPIKN